MKNMIINFLKQALIQQPSSPVIETAYVLINENNENSENLWISLFPIALTIFQQTQDIEIIISILKFIQASCNIQISLEIMEMM